VEPAAVIETIPNFSVIDPDIHHDSEGDDLWTYLMMYRRTGLPFYLNRATRLGQILQKRLQDLRWRPRPELLLRQEQS